MLGQLYVGHGGFRGGMLGQLRVFTVGLEKCMLG